MAVQAGLRRVGSVDFFAALPAGLYLFLVFVAVVGPLPENDNPSLWARMEPFVFELERHPALAVLVLFASYVLGSIMRTLPLQSAERWVTRQSEEFPYPADLALVVAKLERQASSAGLEKKLLVAITPKVDRVVFNFWKDSLSVRSPSALQYYEGFEARSRFFAGMFWAGSVGALSATWLFLPWSGATLTSALQTVFLSLVVAAAFGLRLPRVRKQEAEVLLTLYLALRQNETGGGVATRHD